MKKKLLVLCLVVMFVLPTTVFAGGFLGLKVGAAAILNEPINLEEIDPDYFTALGLEDLSFGADVRFNVSIVEIAALVQGQMIDDGVFLFGHVGLGLSLDLLGLVDLGITAGPELAAYADADGNFISTFDFEDPETLDLIIRATADVNLGGISVGGFVMVDPGVTIGDLMDPGFDPADIEVDTTAKVGISVMVSLL
jgi:hypothetical protein